VNRRLSACIHCNTCDGFPCLVDAKADADLNCVRPAEDNYENLTLLAEAKVLRLHTSPSGREVTSVETDIAGQIHQFSADIVVVACGAINSAALLLRSTNDQHPQRLSKPLRSWGTEFYEASKRSHGGLNEKAESDRIPENDSGE
jgi:choline dehydrogenase-like flavoprotein